MSFDLLTPEERSTQMARIRGRDTRPELIVCDILTQAGVVYRTHDAALPGTPDVVVDEAKAVVFVHGCFWHGRGCRRAKPAINVLFWEEKFRSSVARDKDAQVRLCERGWRVVVVWECEANNRRALIRRLLQVFAPARQGCHDCTDIAVLGYSECARCLAARRGAGREGRKTREKDPGRHARWATLGLCRKCGMPALDGFVCCPCCREKQNIASSGRGKRRRLRNRKEGICVHCSRPAAPSATRCEIHLAIMREEQQRRRRARIAAGLCIECGKPTVDGTQRCATHKETLRIRSAAYVREHRR